MYNKIEGCGPLGPLSLKWEREKRKPMEAVRGKERGLTKRLEIEPIKLYKIKKNCH